MLLTKEKKVISIFFVFLDFIEILKSYKCAVFSVFFIAALMSACCLLLLLPRLRAQL
jgi:hypothetical protein